MVQSPINISKTSQQVRRKRVTCVGNSTCKGSEEQRAEPLGPAEGEGCVCSSLEHRPVLACGMTDQLPGIGKFPVCVSPLNLSPLGQEPRYLIFAPIALSEQWTQGWAQLSSWCSHSHLPSLGGGGGSPSS